MTGTFTSFSGVGHWDVAVHPAVFDVNLISYQDLSELLERAVVRFRGWPVPYIDYRENTVRGQDYIGQNIEPNITLHAEAWRLFTTGQFLHRRVLSADRELLVRGNRPWEPPSQRFVEVWEILFYITEISELAARLSLEMPQARQWSIVINLRGSLDRRLISERPEFVLSGTERAQVDAVEASGRYDQDRLTSSTKTIALDLSNEVLARFGYRVRGRELEILQERLIGGSRDFEYPTKLRDDLF